METYYGGRAECVIRRLPVPGVYVDFTSQYPTVFVLQGLHRFLTAERVDYHAREPRPRAAAARRADRRHGARPRILGAGTARTRADRTRRRPAADPRQYNARARPDADASGDAAAAQLQRRRPLPVRRAAAVVHARRRSRTPSSTTGKAPRILAVLRFTAHGVQPDCEPIDIAGDPAYRVDPRNEDFIKRLVELRDDVRAERNGPLRMPASWSAPRSLDAIQQAMKATANATSYGSAIELNPVEHRKGAWVTVHLPDGSSYRIHRDRTEEPGRWFHPLIATLVAAGGRLLLGSGDAAARGPRRQRCLLRHRQPVHRRHRARPADPLPRRSAHDAQRPSRDQRPHLEAGQTRSSSASPRSTPTPRARSILKIERENYDPDTGRQREIECCSIAAKRYGLFIRRPDGTPEIVGSGDKRKRSEHALGHLLPPNASSPEISDRAWVDDWWEHLLHLELGFTDHPEPAWFDVPAVGRLTVTSQRDIHNFDIYNSGLAYPEQVKPWGFLAVAHPTAHERARPDHVRTLIAPFERDPVRRLRGHWIDPHNPRQEPRRVHTAITPTIRAGSAQVLSYRDYFEQYRHHPETKALDPNDRKPCHTWTRGVLQPWDLTATDQRRIGKESNRLTDSRQPDDDHEQAIEYTRTCRGCDNIVTGRKRWCSNACRMRKARRRNDRRSVGDDVQADTP